MRPQSSSAMPNQLSHATTVKTSSPNPQVENADSLKEALSKSKLDFVSYLIFNYCLFLMLLQIFIIIHHLAFIICSKMFLIMIKNQILNQLNKSLFFIIQKIQAQMQAQKSIDNLFDINVTQCNHILNVQYHVNPKIQKIPVHKGNIFLGGVGSFKEPIINGFRITAVLSILDSANIKRHMIKQKVQHLKILRHKWIDLQDSEHQKIAVYFDDSYLFIKEALKQHNILVHCQMGISRSASILIAFLMKQFNHKYQEAFELVNKKRKFIAPNQGFKNQLIEYEKQLFK